MSINTSTNQQNFQTSTAPKEYHQTNSTKRSN